MSRWLFFPSAGGGFVPSDLASLVGWYDSSDSSTITLSGSEVTAVSNKVSGARDLSNNGTGPSIASANLNGYDVFEVADSEGLSTGTPAPYTSTTSSTMFVGDFNGDARAVVVSSAGGKHGLVYQQGQTGVAPSHGSGTPSTYTDGTILSPDTRDQLYNEITVSGWHILGTIGLLQGAWPNFILFNAVTASGFGTVGKAAEFTIFNTTLSTSDRQKMEGYYAWKYALTSNLPASHPYKSTRP